MEATILAVAAAAAASFTCLQSVFKDRMQSQSAQAAPAQLAHRLHQLEETPHSLLMAGLSGMQWEAVAGIAPTWLLQSPSPLEAPAVVKTLAVALAWVSLARATMAD